MGPKRFWSQNFSLFLVKFKKLRFSAPLIVPVPVYRITQAKEAKTLYIEPVDLYQ